MVVDLCKRQARGVGRCCTDGASWGGSHSEASVTTTGKLSTTRYYCYKLTRTLVTNTVAASNCCFCQSSYFFHVLEASLWPRNWITARTSTTCGSGRPCVSLTKLLAPLQRAPTSLSNRLVPHSAECSALQADARRYWPRVPSVCFGIGTTRLRPPHTPRVPVDRRSTIFVNEL